MLEQAGNQPHPGDVKYGVTLYCNFCDCPAHENVQGHGDNLKGAYEVVTQKYGKKRSAPKGD